jgi:predicted NBD/HSP70 family sugar kinase
VSGPPLSTMDTSDVRRRHLAVVLDQLVRSGPRSRATLAQETGLTKATVSQLVADLLERDLVEELYTPRGGRVGRPSTDVAAAGHTVGGLGLEIDVDRVAASIVDLSGAVRAQRVHEGDNRDVRSSRVVDRLRKAAHEVLAESDAAGIRCVGGTLALPGLVDPEARRLFVAPNLHWFDADLAKAIQRLALPSGLDITVDNEANLAALAELRFGAGRGLSSFVFVSGGIGIGAGIVIDGRLARGAHGFGGELGHVVVDPGGRRCTCGARGCLETIAGADAHAGRDEIATALAAALRSLVHLVDPEAVVLGGTFAAHGDAFADTVRDRLHAITLGARWAPCDVRRAASGTDASLLGAATVAIDRVLADPTIVPARPVAPTSRGPARAARSTRPHPTARSPRSAESPRSAASTRST